MELSNFEKWINWIFRENMVKPTMDDRVPGMSERKNTHIYIYRICTHGTTKIYVIHLHIYNVFIYIYNNIYINTNIYVHMSFKKCIEINIQHGIVTGNMLQLGRLQGISLH